MHNALTYDLGPFLTSDRVRKLLAKEHKSRKTKYIYVGLALDPLARADRAPKHAPADALSKFFHPPFAEEWNIFLKL